MHDIRSPAGVAGVFTRPPEVVFKVTGLKARERLPSVLPAIQSIVNPTPEEWLSVLADDTSVLTVYTDFEPWDPDPIADDYANTFIKPFARTVREAEHAYFVAWGFNDVWCRKADLIVLSRYSTAGCKAASEEAHALTTTRTCFEQHAAHVFQEALEWKRNRCPCGTSSMEPRNFCGRCGKQQRG